MNTQTRTMIYIATAIAVGVAVSYAPPVHNADAIWSIVSLFIGHVMRDLTATEVKP